MHAAIKNLALLLLAALAACDQPTETTASRTDESTSTAAITAIAAPPVATLSGKVTYREQVALTPAAELRIELLELSEDGAATPVAATSITDPGQAPIVFTLPYVPAQIDSQRRYGVTASIREDDQPLLGSAAPVPVLTQGYGDTVELPLEQVNAAP